MQNLGCLLVHGENILVLFEDHKNGRSLKIRKGSTWMGTTLPDESVYLETNPKLLEDLKAGKVVKC